MKLISNALLCIVFFLLIVSSISSAQTTDVGIAVRGDFTGAQLEFISRNFDMVDIGNDLGLAQNLNDYNFEGNIFYHLNSRNVVIGSTHEAECPDYLFAYDSHGNRIYNLRFNQWLMDIYNPEWSSKIINWYLPAVPYVSVLFLDSATSTLGSGYSAVPVGYKPDDYAAAMNDLLTTIKDSVPGLVIYNGVATSLKYRGYGDSLDGGLIEGFIFKPHDQTFDSSRVYTQLNALIKNNDKMTGVMVRADMNDYKKRMFAFAVYLLGAGNKTFYNFADINSDVYALQYYPEYDIDIGNPIEFPDKPNDLLENNLYIRKFEHGLVVVNPFKKKVSGRAPYDVWRVRLHGGGLINDDAEFNGTLSYEWIPKWSRIVFQKRTGSIFLR